jgi:hypothetical protein
MHGKCLSRDDDVENISILSSEDTLDNEDDHPVVTRNTNLHRCILQQPLFITKHQRETKASAHVLTSEQCIKVLEEKEQKKKEAAEFKEKRRLEREIVKVWYLQHCSVLSTQLLIAYRNF